MRTYFVGMFRSNGKHNGTQRMRHAQYVNRLLDKMLDEPVKRQRREAADKKALKEELLERENE